MAEYADLLKKEEKEKSTDYSGVLEGDGDKAVAMAAFGSGFDPENTATPLMRMKLARGDNMKEKNLRLKKKYPEGDVRVVSASLLDERFKDKDKKVLVYRESPNEQYKLVEPEGFDFTDIGEAIVPSLEAIAGEAAMAFLTKGGSIPQTVTRQSIGALAGEALEQMGQTAVSYTHLTLPTITE